ncbi:hypothetical protein OAB40_04050 [Candidatus Pelagibacter ubique]|nr:hypothetical protein [Candidatus Pelagibacter ubique]
MSFHFKKFCEKNKIIISKKKSDKNVIIVDRGRYGSALHASLIASAINHKYEYNVKVLTSKNRDALIIDFYKSFGIEDFIYGANIGSLIKNINNFFSTFLNFIKSSLVISYHPIDWFIDKFEFKGIKVGDLIYDTYIKHKKRYIKPKKDIYFFFLVLRTLYKVINILNLLKTTNVKFIIIGTLSYANNDAIFLRIGIKNKIKVLEPSWYYTNSSLLEYDSYDLKYGPRNIYYDKIQKNKLKKINFSRNFLNSFIKKRFENKVKLYHTKNIDIKIANKTKVNLSRSIFLNKFAKKKIYKKIIIFAPHAFSDAPHGAGYNLCFRDFYSYFTETIDSILEIKNEDVLWVVRPHPLSKAYGEKNIVEDYLKKFNKKNLILCPKGMSTKNLLRICDTVITMKGNIGLELAAIGKMPITCGYPPYSNFGIAIEANSKKKYFNILNKAHEINYKMPKKKQLLAKKILYYMERINPHNKEFRASQNFQDLTLDLNSSKTDLSWKTLSDRLRKNNGFLNDKFYLDALRVI